ncbi:three-Cys-motif partner protein TcmP [Paracoccus cavernae]|uniref:Three-Cys-motif partner protein TcmP n=1 Tax=Paracoccus cavernae TaxID=1571207 RepID=A0ABT8D9S9_9RHOB|nr:three-Cys-motif partner protein TcmP [Paracoccus cavernae]
MAKKSHVEKTVGPWANQKLDALESYLNSYMQVMKKQRFKLFYIDAFAGAGMVKVREGAGDSSTDDLDMFSSGQMTEDDQRQVEAYIKGSPLRALGLERRFDHYRFIDLDPKRVADLNKLAEPFADSEVKVIQDEANKVVQDIASKFVNPSWRGVAFLDPYGPHLHWQTLEALASTGKFDVILNFPLAMAINRQIKRDGANPEKWVSQLDLCFGGPSWRDAAYGEIEGLFGAEQFKHDDAAGRLLRLYVDNLRGIFSSVAAPSLVRNTKGTPLYYLIWASGNARGLPIAEHILKLGEKVSVPRKRKDR